MVTPVLLVEHVRTRALSPGQAQEVRQLCDAAYDTDTTSYFDAIGPGDHLLGRLEGELVSHLMWVPRWLQPGNDPPLRTAYVELVATAPAQQRHGFASALLERVPGLVGDYQLAALSPALKDLYTRLGWRFWRGPLSVRKDDTLIPTPNEQVMVLSLPKSPPLDLDAPLSVEWRPGEVW